MILYRDLLFTEELELEMEVTILFGPEVVEAGWRSEDKNSN